MSVFMRASYASNSHVDRGERAAIPIDFTEALLMVGLALGSKALGIW